MIRTYSVPAEAFVSQGTIIEPLEATENGTYNPPAGTAYSPVVVNVSGSTTYTTIFDGSVTTFYVDGEGEGPASGQIMVTFSGADSIRVTFNGTEYTCEKNAGLMNDYSYGDTSGNFTDYPFTIYDGGTVITQTAGTYTLKIEEPQSSGGDFSTAQVTVVSGSSGRRETYPNIVEIWEEDGEKYIGSGVLKTARTYNVVLYDGKQTAYDDGGAIEGVEGNCTFDAEEGVLVITGDCTITINYTANTNTQ